MDVRQHQLLSINVDVCNNKHILQCTPTNRKEIAKELLRICVDVQKNYYFSTTN